MTRSLVLVIATAALFTPLCALAQDAPDGTEPNSPITAEEESQEPTVRVTSDGAVVEGEHCSAQFSASGLRMRMHGGGRSRNNPDLTYRLDRVEVGSSILFDRTQAVDCVPEVRNGTSIIYMRAAGLVERYEPRTAGVEQLFDIDALPEQDDVRIVGSFRSPLFAASVPRRGVIFYEQRDEQSFDEILCYGEPVIQDSQGRTVRGQVAVVGEQIVLSFAAHTLQGLAFPITVDPLIGSAIAVTANTIHDQNTSIAWNSVENEYLIVWDALGTASYDVWGRVYDASGVPVTAAKKIQAQISLPERYPSVAYSPATNRYVLVMEQNGDDIIQTTTDADGDKIGTSPYVDNSRTGISSKPTITYKTSDTFLITWSDSGTGTNRYLYAELRDSNKYVVGGIDDELISDVPSSNYYGKNATVYNSEQDDFLIVWEHVDGTIRMELRDGNVDDTVRDESVVYSSGLEPSVTWRQSEKRYQVVFANNTVFPGSYDVFLQKVTATAPAGYTTGGLRIVTDASYDQRNPEIRYSSAADESLVTWDTTTASSLKDVRAQAIWGHGALREASFGVDTGSYDTLNASIAHNGTNYEFLCAWEDKRGTDWEIYAQRIRDAAPRVIEADPPGNATNVPTDFTAIVYFSDPMDASTITTSTCRIRPVSGGGAVPATVTYNGTTRTARIDPTSALSASTNYYLEVLPGALDIAGNATGLFLVIFQTATGAGLGDCDTDGLLDVEEQRLGIYGGSCPGDDNDYDNDGVTDFDELYLKVGEDVTSATFFQTDAKSTDTDKDGTADGSDADPLNPRVPNDPGTDSTPPRVVSFNPSNGAQNVPANAKIYAAFSEPINTLTVTPSSLTVKDLTPDPDQTVSGSFSFQNGNRVVMFTPSSNLANSHTIEVKVLSGSGMIADLAGNTATPTRTITFGTEASGGSGGVAANEPLHHPSKGESTSAGQMGRASGSGNVPYLAPHSIYASANPLGTGEGCRGCEVCTSSVHEPDVRCTGLEPTFGHHAQSDVFLHNGVFVYTCVDRSHPDRSLHDVVFSRTYRSNLKDPSTGQPFDGLFGERTVSNWETRLLSFTSATQTLTLLTGDGRFYTFPGRVPVGLNHGGFAGNVSHSATDQT